MGSSDILAGQKRVHLTRELVLVVLVSFLLLGINQSDARRRLAEVTTDKPADDAAFTDYDGNHEKDEPDDLTDDLDQKSICSVLVSAQIEEGLDCCANKNFKNDPFCARAPQKKSRGLTENTERKLKGKFGCLIVLIKSLRGVISERTDECCRKLRIGKKFKYCKNALPPAVDPKPKPNPPSKIPPPGSAPQPFP